MASRFTFTEKQFNEIKKLIADGKTYRQIGDEYDLGHSTLRRINRAPDFVTYRRNQLIISHNRRLKRHRREAIARLCILAVILVAGIELVAILMLWGN